MVNAFIKSKEILEIPITEMQYWERTLGAPDIDGYFRMWIPKNISKFLNLQKGDIIGIAIAKLEVRKNG